MVGVVGVGVGVKLPHIERNTSEPRPLPPALPTHRQRACNKPFACSKMQWNQVGVKFPHVMHWYILGKLESVTVPRR